MAIYITIYKTTESIESNNIFEFKDDKGVTRLLVDSKVILIVLEYIFPFKNIPHSTGFIFYGTNVRNF